MEAGEPIPLTKQTCIGLTAGLVSHLRLERLLHFETPLEWSAAEQVSSSWLQNSPCCSRCLPDPWGGFPAAGSVIFLFPEALLAWIPLGSLWKHNPPLLSSSDHSRWLGSGAQSGADSVVSFPPARPLAVSTSPLICFSLAAVSHAVHVSPAHSPRVPEPAPVPHITASMHLSVAPQGQRPTLLI
jgi:hypothetical protein